MISNSDFQILYKSLFLTQDEVAHIGGYKDTRTVRRFIDGSAPAHDDLVETLLDWDQRIDAQVSNVLGWLSNEGRDSAVLLAYRDQTQYEVWADEGYPLVNLHRAMLSRLCKAADYEEITLVTVEFNPEAFSEYAAEHDINPREATQQQKARWAVIRWNELKADEREEDEDEALADLLEDIADHAPEFDFIDVKLLANFVNEMTGEQTALRIDEPFSEFINDPQGVKWLSVPDVDRFPIEYRFQLDPDDDSEGTTVFKLGPCSLLVNEAPSMAEAYLVDAFETFLNSDQEDINELKHALVLEERKAFEGFERTFTLTETKLLARLINDAYESDDNAVALNERFEEAIERLATNEPMTNAALPLENASFFASLNDFYPELDGYESDVTLFKFGDYSLLIDAPIEDAFEVLMAGITALAQSSPDDIEALAAEIEAGDQDEAKAPRTEFAHFLEKYMTLLEDYGFVASAKSVEPDDLLEYAEDLLDLFHDPGSEPEYSEAFLAMSDDYKGLVRMMFVTEGSPLTQAVLSNVTRNLCEFLEHAIEQESLDENERDAFPDMVQDFFRLLKAFNKIDNLNEINPGDAKAAAEQLMVYFEEPDNYKGFNSAFHPFADAFLDMLKDVYIDGEPDPRVKAHRAAEELRNFILTLGNEATTVH